MLLSGDFISPEVSSSQLSLLPYESSLPSALISSCPAIAPAGKPPTNSPVNCQEHTSRRAWGPGFILGKTCLHPRKQVIFTFNIWPHPCSSQLKVLSASPPAYDVLRQLCHRVIWIHLRAML